MEAVNQVSPTPKDTPRGQAWRVIGVFSVAILSACSNPTRVISADTMVPRTTETIPANKQLDFPQRGAAWGGVNPQYSQGSFGNIATTRVTTGPSNDGDIKIGTESLAPGVYELSFVYTSTHEVRVARRDGKSWDTVLLLKPSQGPRNITVQLEIGKGGGEIWLTTRPDKSGASMEVGGLSIQIVK